ncbi:hypothetical protein CRG98_036837 [Punica granatum]|uniref:Protein kinase domain-containing protein n=1 Tax=Punica granatum TaxID=22663 RepID=A0A2I0IFD9_PUNGR|nr:hypothetical protein CRG98_036837 [Punica granatum]
MGNTIDLSKFPRVCFSPSFFSSVPHSLTTLFPHGILFLFLEGGLPAGGKMSKRRGDKGKKPMDSAGSGVLRTYTKTFLDEKTEAGNIVGVGGTSKAEKKNFMDLAENPHIVKLRGYAEEGPYMALVFDYLPHLSWLDVKKIMKQLAQGMKYIHDKGYVLADFKCDNVLLDEANNAKIIDLGAVKKLGPGKKSIWAQSITVEYLPPEAQRGECTTRSDIFSFGTSILQLLAKKEKPGGPRKGDGRSGKTKKKNDEEDHISVEVMRQYGRERHVLHPRLFGEARKNAAEKISNLALKCTKLADGYKSMDEIIGDVDEI